MGFPAQFKIVYDQGLSLPLDSLVIQDIGNHATDHTVTNDVENVVKTLYAGGYLKTGQPLFYFDSAGDLDEILHSDGHFIDFKPGPNRGT